VIAVLENGLTGVPPIWFGPARVSSRVTNVSGIAVTGIAKLKGREWGVSGVTGFKLWALASGVMKPAVGGVGTIKPGVSAPVKVIGGCMIGV